MKYANVIGLVMLVLMVAGCKEAFLEPDLIAPSSPRGLATTTGDNQIEISWLPNPEPDVAGYNVYASSSYNGKYTLIGSTKETLFIDRGISNGVTYYYAVSAYDFAGNESPFSQDVAYDTPRPEGYDVGLKDYRAYPDYAGYDFSTYSVVAYDDHLADMYFENFNGTLYLNVWQDSDIQDVGYTTSLYDVGDAPTSGWSPSKDARLITGHTYIIRTWDNHYAKVRVTSLSANGMYFDWAYQLQSNNTRLKQIIPSQRGTLTAGSGVSSRM